MVSDSEVLIPILILANLQAGGYHLTNSTQQYKPNSHYDFTGTEWPVTTSQTPHISEA